MGGNEIFWILDMGYGIWDTGYRLWIRSEPKTKAESEGRSSLFLGGTNDVIGNGKKVLSAPIGELYIRWFWCHSPCCIT